MVKIDLKKKLCLNYSEGELMRGNNDLEKLKEELKEKKSLLKEKDKSLNELQDKLEKIEKNLKEKDQKIEDYFSQIQRLQADFENYKKRNEKDRKEYIKFANEGLILKIIEIYEDLERALKSSENGENLKEGVELIYKNLNDVFEKEGLEIIPAEGEKFDPFKHEALMTENNEKYENGIVTEELAKGYTLNSKVIKCTMVKVCKK